MTSALTPGAAQIFDGTRWHADSALKVENGRVIEVVPAGAQVDYLVPGFVDLQVNGGGGVQFNDAPSVKAIDTIARAHRINGTTSLLVTLITDTVPITEAAISAAAKAISISQKGFIGLHLEGPHLDTVRKGTHAAELIRPMTEADLKRILSATKTCGNLLVTLAPEAVSNEQIEALATAGVHLALGHTDCSNEVARSAFSAGVGMVTHLFNAMSPLKHRAPGLVGAALNAEKAWVGLIADGFHVAPEAMSIALRSKLGPGKIFLVSDAMAVTGSDMTQFSLNGRTIHRDAGRLILADGTLAGADITMMDAVHYCHRQLGLELAEVLRMAALYPAEAIGARRKGRLEPGADADFLVLDNELELQSVWIGGKEERFE